MQLYIFQINTIIQIRNESFTPYIGDIRRAFLEALLSFKQKLVHVFCYLLIEKYRSAVNYKLYTVQVEKIELKAFVKKLSVEMKTSKFK